MVTISLPEFLLILYSFLVPERYIFPMKKTFLGLLAFFLFFFPPAVHAQDIATTEKMITVDTGAQYLRAWDGGHVVYETPVSTGLPKSPTVKGTFRIYLKYPVQASMRGYSPYSGNYNLPNVPNVMYFYEGYAIHGAYWHNAFGSPRSNGCVNVPLEAASYLFSFAPVGTKVVIY